MTDELWCTNRNEPWDEGDQRQDEHDLIERLVISQFRHAPVGQLIDPGGQSHRHKEEAKLNDDR